MKMIVHNGMVKLTIPFKNGVSGKNKEMFRLSKESSITFIGIQDTLVIIDIENDASSGNIWIEFSPAGAYRLFQLRQSELKNRIFLLEEVLGKPAKEIQEIIANTESINEKIRIIQTYLIKLLSESESDRILDYCIQLIKNSKGLVTVTELEKETGYSSRWLYEKFIGKVGLGPKGFSSIVRFMQFYEQWIKNPASIVFKDDVYNYFYDQSHFIKEFKRFTGLSPLKFIKSENEFGEIFYKD